MTSSERDEITARASPTDLPPKVPFLFRAESKRFCDKLLRTMRHYMDVQVMQIIPPENISRYGHGQQWAARSSDQPDDIHTFQEHSTAIEIRGQDVVDGKLEILPSHIKEITGGFFEGVMKSLYATVRQSTERTGNIVSAKQAGSLAVAFRQALEKVAFGVDEQGNVSIPTFHMPPELAERLQLESEALGPEFIREIEEIKARKIREALAEEAARRKRFKGLAETET